MVDQDVQQRDLVADPDDQSIEWIGLHCQKRHPHLRYLTRGEHQADHRLHDFLLDHDHE